LQEATKLLKRRKVIFSLSFAAAKWCTTAPPPPTISPTGIRPIVDGTPPLFHHHPSHSSHLSQLLLAVDAFGSGQTAVVRLVGLPAHFVVYPHCPSC